MVENQDRTAVQPINHDAENLSEALGVNLQEASKKMTDKFGEISENDGTLSTLVEFLEDNLSKRELAGLLVGLYAELIKTRMIMFMKQISTND